MWSFSVPMWELINSVASYYFPASTLPKKLVNALIPHGAEIGLLMGAKALTLKYFPGFLKAQTKAPCPPIECPVMDYLEASTSKKLVTT